MVRSVPMTMAGALSERGDQAVGMYCPIERALATVSTRSAMLLLREAFYGATRFDEFVARTGLTEATTAQQLKLLETAGIFERKPYQEPGQRSREGYVLTAAGIDLMPVLFALFQWANQHDPPPYPPAMHHVDCGGEVSIVAECEHRHRVGVNDISVTAPGPFGIPRPKRPT
jgi:DNA-binding HxlR family transcriptional regulator